MVSNLFSIPYQPNGPIGSFFQFEPVVNPYGYIFHRIIPNVQNWSNYTKLIPTQETKQFEPDENDIKLEV